jgi:Domain of unknown function (DUF4157)/NAD:arginine ADP-ribosyltransferase
MAERAMARRTPATPAAARPSRAAAARLDPAVTRVGRHVGRYPAGSRSGLTVGASIDGFEREADRTADRVMRSIGSRGFVARAQSDSSGSDSAGSRGADPGPAGSAYRCGPDGVRSSTAAAHVWRVATRSAGRPLDPQVRARMDRAFGVDFGGVRVHTDLAADTLNRAVGASASTLGNHVYFRDGAYRPTGSHGDRLLAHELTHVVQQRGATGPARGVGAAYGGPEVAAEATAARVAAGGTVDAAAIAPAPSGVVQRQYLDQNPASTGYQNWLADTKVKKGLTTVSRDKLTYVDGLLRGMLAQVPPLWPATLPVLDAGLALTKYANPTTKLSGTFTKRAKAVQRLRYEIAAASAALAPPLGAPPPLPVLAMPVLPLTPVAALQQVGFPQAYLQGLPPADLTALHDAHQALAAGNMVQAQAIFDVLNPPTAFTGTKNVATGWAAETYDSINPPGMFDFARGSDQYMAAQRQLLAYHAPTIGGDYGAMLSYKPYKAQPLTAAEIQAGEAYFDSAHLRDWDTTIELGNAGAALLSDAKLKAPNVAAASTAASVAKGKVKPAKAALTDAEVTALRIYTADEYREMNAVFRDFRVDNPTVNWAKYSAIAKLAISGLGKLPKARGTTSYRGDNDVRFGGHAGLLKQGATFRLPNFYSTTMQPGSAFGGDLAYVFHNRKAGRVIEKFSAYAGEAEVLIPPGAAFRITHEYHNVGGAWQLADGTPAALSPAAQLFLAGDGHPRTMLLEFDEI